MILLTITILITILIIPIILRFSVSEDFESLPLKDEQGRALILHGVNVNKEAKSDPLHVGETSRETFHRYSEELGFNAVRLLLFWEGIEPAMNSFDDLYLERVRERLDWCHEAGLKVILDLHQDLYARRFGGDGAPEWAIQDKGLSFEYKSPWELNYLQPAVQTAINSFWITEPGEINLQSKFIKAAQYMAGRLSHHPAVIGIDLYNEPTMASLKGLRSFEKKYLHPFLQELIHAIRDVNENIYLFIEPSALGPNQGFKTKLPPLRDSRKGDDRLVYFPHLYSIDTDITGRYMGKPWFINFWVHARQREFHKFPYPLLTGEFGLDESGKGALQYLKDTVSIFDKTTSGWFYWDDSDDGWGLYNPDGTEQQKTSILERTFPRAINGMDYKFHWDPDRAVFTMSFISLPGKLCSEIYLSRELGESWELISKGIPFDYEYEESGRILKIFTPTAGQIDFKIRKAN